MSDPFQDYLNQLLMANPEWVGGGSKTAHYAPPDVGSQQSQLNYVQDLSGTGMDPIQLWLAGQIDSGDLQSTFEDDQVIPAVTQGSDTLQKIRDQSPGSVEGFIADGLLNGQTSSQAIQYAVDAGLINVPKITDASGNQKDDTSELDRYRKFADSSWQALLADKPEQRTPGKEILHPFVQRMLDAGFKDPRQMYTPDYVDPGLQGLTDQRSQSMDSYKNAVSAYKASMAPQQQGMPSSAHGAGAQHHARPAPTGVARGARGAAAHHATTPANAVAPRINQGANKAAMQTAQRKAIDDNYSMIEQRAHARAVSDFLQQQGRSPAKDQYMAVLENLKRRGVGS